MARAHFREIHLLVDGSHQDQGTLCRNQAAHFVIVGFFACCACHGKGTGQPKITFKEMPNAAGIGFIRHDAKIGRCKEILRDRPPQIPNRLEGRMLFAGDKRLGI